MSLSLAEVNNLVSRVTGVTGALVAQVAGSLHHDIVNNRQQWSSVGNDAVLSFVMRNAPQELLDQMKSNADATDRAMKRDLAALAPVYKGLNFDMGRGGSFGSPWNMPGPDGRGGAANTGNGSRANYQDISYNSPQSLYSVTSINYMSTPYARAGMSNDTFRYIQNYFSRHDPAITGQNVIDAAKDVKRFGFGPNNKEAVRDQAIIRHYDDKPEETVKALEKYSKPNPEDQAKLDKLNIDLMKAKTPEARAAAQQAIKAFHGERRKTTGVQGRIDSTPTKKAKDAIGRQGDRIERNLNNQSLERIKKKGYRADATPDPVENDHKGPSHADLSPSTIIKRGDTADADIGRGMDQIAALESSNSTPFKQAEAAQKPQDKSSKEGKPSSGTQDLKPNKSSSESNKEPTKPVVVADKPKKPSGPSVA